MALQPVFVMAGAFVFFKERTSTLAKAGMGIAMIGSILVGWGDIGLSDRHMIGDILSILGTIAISIHILTGQRLLLRLPSYLYSLLVFLAAAIVFAIYNLAMGITMVNYPLREWGIFALLTVVPTVFGHLLFNWLLQYTGATTISMSILGEPIGASLLAFLLLNERMTVFQIIGGLIVIFGLYLFLRKNKEKTIIEEIEKGSTRTG
ncbi:DMT family transporter [Fictibacillus sp. Mic-4]|uniref:DMT family transporter n=1 Tax=Fictibacillus sp. Mic-4 TaxID=3132826 RepID=UPI003CF32E0D